MSKPTINPQIDRMLRDAGLRRTPTRMAVLRVLLDAERPLNRPEVLAWLKNRDADPVTVYRTLNTFVAAGIVHCSYLEGRKLHFETAERCADDHCHPHFVCRLCHEATCMDDAEVALVRNLRHGYIAERQQILVQGVCAACAQGDGERGARQQGGSQ